MIFLAIRFPQMRCHGANAPFCSQFGDADEYRDCLRHSHEHSEIAVKPHGFGRYSDFIPWPSVLLWHFALTGRFRFLVLYSLNRISGRALEKFHRIIIVAAALALTGCGLPFMQIRDKLSALHGQPLSAATAKLGQPMEQTEIFGKKVYVWKKQPGKDGDGDDQECVIRAFMKGDVIDEIHFTGDEGQCYRFARTLDGS